MTPQSYVALQFPKQASPSLVRKFASLNAEAKRAIQEPILLYAPQFLRSIESWKADFEDPRYFGFVLITPNIETGAVTLEEGHWVGMWTFYGPLSAKDYNFTNPDKIQTGADDRETRWLGERTYLKEQHRNAEAFGLLEKAMRGFLTEKTKGLLGPSLKPGSSCQVCARVQVVAYYGKSANEIHKSSGAQVVMEMTRVQDLEYDNLLKDIPDEFLTEEDHSRHIGTLYEYFFEVIL